MNQTRGRRSYVKSQTVTAVLRDRALENDASGRARKRTRIVYTDFVAGQMAEPDYDATRAAPRAAVARPRADRDVAAVNNAR
jgi:hypothetical protein